MRVFMKKKFTVPFLILAICFSVFLVLSNLLEVKVVKIGWLTATAGLSVFPVSYIINDCITEVYGFQRARFVIWIGFIMNLFVVLFLQLAIALPADPTWHGQAAFEIVFRNTPRILLGSFTAFICGSMVNAQVMSKMKVMNKGKYFSLRAVLSTFFGESVDSIIFFPIAFGGILPTKIIITLIWTQAVLKTVYEIVVLPLTIWVVKFIKNKEQLDTYDTEVDYRWWRIDKL
jgi:uncharacterized integral membrane protein (TIGR00697 family)